MPERQHFPLGALAAVIALLLAGCTEPSDQLPRLAARIDQTSASGISSGAYMAGQLQIAHSSMVIGAAIIAGGPYGCAESLFADLMPGMTAGFINAQKAINGCMLGAMQLWGVPNPGLLAERVEALAARGAIDPAAGVRTDRVYLFSGTRDRVVVPSVVASAAEFYRRLGVPADAIKLVGDRPAGHAFITETEGLACGETGKPFVADCDYDQAGDLLAHIHGPLQPPASKAAGDFRAFDQRPFTQGLGHHGMSDFGVVYVPRECVARPGCRVHVAFHGCAQNEAAVGDAFVRRTGFQRWADTNRLIVLFPQTAASAVNPQGCWDWWGYTGRDFLTRRAPQITAVKRMLERLAEPAAAT